MKIILLSLSLISTFMVSSAQAVDEKWVNDQYNYSLEKIFNHTSRPDTSAGFVIAAPSKSYPNYYFHWVRDAALVMNSLQETLSFEKFQPMAHDYIKLVSHHQNISKLTNQGEPKFNPDGTSFTGPWGRPQNDGPALRVITLTQYALELIKRGEIEYVRNNLYNPSLPARTVIKVDLEYTSHHFQEDDFDLWEEIKGTHFYTKMAQRKAMLMGSKLAKLMGDDAASEWYFAKAQKLNGMLRSFWSKDRNYILSTINRTGGLEKPSRLDSSSILAVLHSGVKDYSFNHSDNRILRTVDKLVSTFKDIYPINNNFAGVGIGRYAEDTYFGGQPWFLLTAGLSEYYYELASRINKMDVLKIHANNWSFYNKTVGVNVATQNITNKNVIKLIVNKLIQLGDENLERIKIHSGSKLQLDEQFGRHSGYMTGAPHLTWSYGAFITAINARKMIKKK
jgi:glucoamylase